MTNPLASTNKMTMKLDQEILLNTSRQNHSVKFDYKISSKMQKCQTQTVHSLAITILWH